MDLTIHSLHFVFQEVQIDHFCHADYFQKGSKSPNWGDSITKLVFWVDQVWSEVHKGYDVVDNKVDTDDLDAEMKPVIKCVKVHQIN